MNRFKITVLLVAAVGLLASGCAKKSPIPRADVSRLEAERAIVIAQGEIEDASKLGADVTEPSSVLQQARGLFEEERYARAYSEAVRAGNLAGRLKAAMIAGGRLREDASAAIDRAENLIGQARGLGGDTSGPAGTLKSAKESFGKEDYRAAIDLADRAAGEATALIATLRAERYTVGTWESDRDCLWNIAARTRIYNDPWKWKRIYQSNQGAITNPDLIFPGQILVIPRD